MPPTILVTDNGSWSQSFQKLLTVATVHIKLCIFEFNLYCNFVKLVDKFISVYVDFITLRSPPPPLSLYIYIYIESNCYLDYVFNVSKEMVYQMRAYLIMRDEMSHL